MSTREEWYATLRQIADAEKKTSTTAAELRDIRRSAARKAREEGLTLYFIGNALGVTRQRVHQILKEAA